MASSEKKVKPLDVKPQISSSPSSTQTTPEKASSNTKQRKVVQSPAEPEKAQERADEDDDLDLDDIPLDDSPTKWQNSRLKKRKHVDADYLMALRLHQEDRLASSSTRRSTRTSTVKSVREGPNKEKRGQDEEDEEEEDQESSEEGTEARVQNGDKEYPDVTKERLEILKAKKKRNQKRAPYVSENPFEMMHSTSWPEKQVIAPPGSKPIVHSPPPAPPSDTTSSQTLSPSHSNPPKSPALTTAQTSTIASPSQASPVVSAASVSTTSLNGQTQSPPRPQSNDAAYTSPARTLSPKSPALTTAQTSTISASATTSPAASSTSVVSQVSASQESSQPPVVSSPPETQQTITLPPSTLPLPIPSDTDEEGICLPPKRRKPTPNLPKPPQKEPQTLVEEANHPESLPTLDVDGFYNMIERKKTKYDDFGGWKTDEEKYKEGTYINCDLRYFNLSALSKFDVILIDPPWRIRGNEVASNERTMFHNSKFSLEYGTLSNEEIIDIDVGCLSDRGFIFMWVINSQLQFAFECMTRWGYTYVDRIIWVKKTNNANIAIGQGYYFLHSTEMVLIGIKSVAGEQLEYISKVSNDVIFAEIRDKSQKPDQLYSIIEKMMPGCRKIELFARNHHIRPGIMLPIITKRKFFLNISIGWLSLGNQLGWYYDWGHDLINCDKCHNPIKSKSPRYKHRSIANRDLCANCFQASGDRYEDYFYIENVVEEMTFHEYFECDGCHTKPIWGIRFHCLECPNLDLCEDCHDKRFCPPGHPEHGQHRFKAIELPDLAGGLPLHRVRCLGCLTSPIVGYRFICTVCNNLSLCQKCFFKKKEPKSHNVHHDMELVCEPDEVGHTVEAAIKCDSCGIYPIPGDRYRCNSCYSFIICHECFSKNLPPPPSYVTHKSSHKFTQIAAPQPAKNALPAPQPRSNDATENHNANGHQ